MQSCYDEAIGRVLRSEGGYVNNSRDPGGPTNFGITIAVYRQNGHQGATAADVKAMPLAEARRIYRLRYANPCGFDALPAGLDYAVLDYAVNSGVGRATKVLRRICALAENAPFSAVLTAIGKREIKSVIAAYNAERLRFLQSLKTWGTFGKGWGPRVAAVNAAALHMADMPISTVRPDVSAPADQVPQGKGEVPKPDITKPIIVGGGSSSAAATVSGWGWIAAHPIASTLIAVIALAVIVVVAEMIAHHWQKAKQDAPTPGLVPVPEKV